MRLLGGNDGENSLWNTPEKQERLAKALEEIRTDAAKASAIHQLRWKIIREEFPWLAEPNTYRYPADIKGETPDEIRAYLAHFEQTKKNKNKPILKKK